MEIEINGKKFEINEDPRFGIMELMQKAPEEPKYIRLFIKEILLPTPSAEEIFNFRKSDIVKIIKTFQEAEEEETVEIRKKHS